MCTKQGKEPNQSEMQALFAPILAVETLNPLSYVSLIPQYFQSYVPKSSVGTFPQPLKSLCHICVTNGFHTGSSYPFSTMYISELGMTLQPCFFLTAMDISLVI